MNRLSTIAAAILLSGCIAESTEPINTVGTVDDDTVVVTTDDENNNGGPTPRPAYETHSFQRCTVLMGGWFAKVFYQGMVSLGWENGLSAAVNDSDRINNFDLTDGFLDSIWNDLDKNTVGCDMGATQDIILMVEARYPKAENDLGYGSHILGAASIIWTYFKPYGNLENIYIMSAPGVEGEVCTAKYRRLDQDFAKMQVVHYTERQPELNAAINGAVALNDSLGVDRGSYQKLVAGNPLYYESCNVVLQGNATLYGSFLTSYAEEE